MRKQRGRDKIKECRMPYYHPVDINDELIRNLRDLSHVIHLLYEGKGSQKRILIILNEVGSISQRELTQRLGIQPGSVSEVLAKLEAAGLIIRIPGILDRRTSEIQLTDRGKVLAEEAALQRKKRHEEMFACLTQEEKQNFLSIMKQVYSDWEVRYLGKNEENE